MLHRTIFYLYVCKANNNVREGRSLKKVPCNCNEIENRSSYIQKNKKTRDQKTRKRVQTTKTENRNNSENKTQSHENNKQCSENRKQKLGKIIKQIFSCRYQFGPHQPYRYSKRFLETTSHQQYLWENGCVDG